jgi:hypothetical protein
MPTNTYTALATVTLASTAATITFSSIPATYRDLILVGSGTASVSAIDIGSRLNSDSGSNYSQVAMFAIDDGSIGSSSSTETYFGAGRFSASRANFQTQFLDYSATDKHKTILTRYDDATVVTVARAARWASTSAINSISLFNSGGNGQVFAIGTTFSLYGVIA